MTTATVKMKLFPVLAVLAAVLLVVHADFYVNLYYEPTEKYLSAINYGGVGGTSFLKAAKNEPDYFTRIKLVTTDLPNGKVALLNSPGTKYFCRFAIHGTQFYNYIIEDNYNPNCVYEYKILIGSNRFRISLKANNGKFLALGGYDGTFITATGNLPVYYDVIKL